MKFKTFKTPPVILGMFFLMLGCFYSVIKQFGYIFIPVPIIGDICSGTLIIWLTNKTIEGVNFMPSDLVADEIWLVDAAVKKENTKNKLTSAFLFLMPFTATFFLHSKWHASNLINIDKTLIDEIIPFLYLMHAYFTIVCGLQLFLFRIRGKAKRITKMRLIVPTLLILFPYMFLILFGSGVAELFGVTRITIVSEMSPNNVYLGKIIEGDAGATGGSTAVYIIPQREVRLLFGVLKKETQTLHGRWGEYRTLRWETDEILYINGRKYFIEDGELIRE